MPEARRSEVETLNRFALEYARQLLCVKYPEVRSLQLVIKLTTRAGVTRILQEKLAIPATPPQRRRWNRTRQAGDVLRYSSDL